jgi:fluoride ion exporter CrcB/FEX
MNALRLSCIIFVLIHGGILLGAMLRRALPEHHLSKESQDVVRLGTRVLATIAALVLGLLIAAAKNSFDTENGQVKQITADIILLDKAPSIRNAANTLMAKVSYN